MDWNAIGAIGEIIGALAVFLTLAYLALQVRQNTRTIQASAVDASINKLQAVRISLYESPSASEGETQEGIYVDQQA